VASSTASQCSLVAEATLALTYITETSNRSAATAAAFSRQTSAAGVLQMLQDCEDSDDPRGCKEQALGRLKAVITDIATKGTTSCLAEEDNHNRGTGQRSDGCQNAINQDRINQYPRYEPAASEYGEDQLEFCSTLALSVPAHFDETTCCAILDTAAPWRKHCGPRSSKYLIGEMDWDNGYSMMWIAASDAAHGYRIFPDECSANKLKLKPKWQAVDLESDDWRLAALVRLLAGVEGDYHDMTTDAFSFTNVFGSLNSGAKAANGLDDLPAKWRGFPVYVNPTCSGGGSTRQCAFVFVWVATHMITDDITLTSTRHKARAVLSRSHPALVYWRALTEPRDFWECDAFGDQCKYDAAHPDDCIDAVTFPIKFTGRTLAESLANGGAVWRSELSGAVVFSEALFGARPKSATIDLIDGFEANCAADVSFQTASGMATTAVVNGSTVSLIGRTISVQDDAAADANYEDGSRVVELLGNLFDTIGPAALPLLPLVVAYVAFDEFFEQYKSGELTKNFVSAVDGLTKGPVVAFERLFDVLFG